MHGGGGGGGGGGACAPPPRLALTRLTDVVSVKLRCTLGENVSEHAFSAQKTTLEGLGFANMEEGAAVRACVRVRARACAHVRLSCILGSLDVSEHGLAAQKALEHRVEALAVQALGGHFVCNVHAMATLQSQVAWRVEPR